MTDKVIKDRISLLLADRERINQALAKAVQDALLKHKQAGNPVAIWRDGKVVWIPPEEILAEENKL
ncbi:MAG: hypothetical protein RIE73_29180 [Coleofasciculus sp. C1-SOL-03]|jgi:hypothetical protein|uniref:hypothetical protein n=1 Tax=Coleofasciculus sp. C1-SOL-03 TaxID=3069522 RepID=UPI0032FED3BC